MRRHLSTAVLVALGFIAPAAVLVLAVASSAAGMNVVSVWIAFGVILGLIWYDVLYHVRLVRSVASQPEDRGRRP